MGARGWGRAVASHAAQFVGAWHFALRLGGGAVAEEVAHLALHGVDLLHGVFRFPDRLRGHQGVNQHGLLGKRGAELEEGPAPALDLSEGPAGADEALLGAEFAEAVSFASVAASIFF